MGLLVYRLFIIIVFLVVSSYLQAFSLPIFQPKVDKYTQTFFDEYLKSLPSEEKKTGEKYVDVYREAYKLLQDNYLYAIDDAKQQELAQEAQASLKKHLAQNKKENKKIQAQELMENIMGDVFNNIDAHTLWMTSAQAKDFASALSGNYEGIGILFSPDVKQKGIMVLKTFQGSPAYKAGITKNDIIISVNDKSISELKDIASATALIKGPEGTEVTLGVLRGDEKLTIKVKRGSYYVPSVDYYVLNNKYGIISIHSFNNDTAALFRNAISAMKVNDLQGLVIDVRDNPGGLLTAVVLIGDSILSEENIVSIKGRVKDNDKTFISINQSQIKPSLPIVVLTNFLSASASELLTGALALNNRATVIGDNTFGKWSVQSSFELQDGSVFNVTSQLFYAPKNSTFQGEGIAPDIQIKPSQDTKYFHEKDYENALQVPDVNLIKRHPKVFVKEKACPLMKDANVQDNDYILGCAVLYLDSTEDLNVFLSKLN